MRKRGQYFALLWALILVLIVAAPPVFAADVQGSISVIPGTPNTYLVGDTIDYVMRVTNTSDDTEYDVDRVWFIYPDGVTEDTLDINTIIAPGDFREYFRSYVVDAADLFLITAGPATGFQGVRSGFKAQGLQDVNEVEVFVQATSVVIQPAIDIEKHTNGEDADMPTGPVIEVGGLVEWKYIVTNTGDSPLVDVVVTDDQEGFVGTIPELLQGASVELFMFGTAQFGQYANLADVVGTPKRGSFTFPQWDVTDIDPSHYIGVMPALVVEKTASASFDRTVRWELDKSVDPSFLSGVAGQEFPPVKWLAEAAKTEELGNYWIFGEINIYNPAVFAAQEFSVTDFLDDGTLVVLSQESGIVGPGQTLSIAYSAVPMDATATLNTAVVEALYNVPVTAMAPVMFVENLIGDDEVLFTDDRFAFTLAISGTSVFSFDEIFECAADASLYVDGSYSFFAENIATLTGPNTDLEATATVVIECVLPLLEIAKTAEASYDRTVEWTLDKTVDQDFFSGMAGDLFGPVTWTVSGTKTVTVDNFRISGDIVITNPAAVDQDFVLLDELDDGTLVILSQTSGTVPAGQSITITYTAVPSDASATLNTATVTADGNPPQVATADVEFAENLIGYDEGDLTDPRFDFAVVVNDDFSYSFEELFECSADASMYTDGQYTFTEVNWAYLNGNIGLSASAEVTIRCELPGLCWGDETAWAYGDDFANPNWDYVNNRFWGWTNGPLSEGSYEWPIYAGAGQNDISKGMLVGALYVDYADGCVTVNYALDPGYYLSEVHLWIGQDVLPEVQRGRGTVYTNAPGQFPYGGYLGFEQGIVMESVWEDTICGFEGDIYVAAHSVVWMEVECEE